MVSILIGVVLAQPPGPASAPVSAPASAPATAPAQKAAPVTLRGKAENAKLSAILVGDGGGVLYLIDLPEWPADQLGRQVEVTGVIEVTDSFKAFQDENGNWSQGTGGADALMRGAKIKVLEPPPKSP